MIVRKLWLALIFVAGGFVQEMRHPTSCELITARQVVGATKRKRSASSP
jgi:hypothetical protein